MSKSNRYSPEVRERAVRLVRETEKDHKTRMAPCMAISRAVLIEEICLSCTGGL